MFVVEQNRDAQLCAMLTAELDVQNHKLIPLLHYNGFPISSEQTAEWMREAGFEGIRLIEPIGFQFCYVATKPASPRQGETP